MTARKILTSIAFLAMLGAAFYASGLADRAAEHFASVKEGEPDKRTEALPHAPVVTVARAKRNAFVETVRVTGSLVPREEIIVAPEVEGLRILSLNVEEGDHVEKGQVLATLVASALDAQIAQNDAAQARATASIAQAKSQITEAEARVAEADAALERARPLLKSNFISESVFDERTAAAKTARARLAAAEDGLRLAEAELAQSVAVRRELDWRRGNTEVRAPATGIVSRRGARIGSIAVGGTIAGAGESMFRIIAEGEIELDAEVTERDAAKVRVGQRARIEIAGVGAVEGKVRLVSPEIDRTTRLAKARIYLGTNPALRIGAFGRGTIETASSEGLAIPQSAVLYSTKGASVLVVHEGRVTSRTVETGLAAGRQIEIRAGLSDGDLVVAKAGTFLRDGDAVRAIELGDEPTTVSEAGQ